MSIFSRVKKAKVAANEHKKTAAVQDEAKQRVPYKHVPIHAAQDALSSAPGAVDANDLRARIALAKRQRALTHPGPGAERRGIYISSNPSPQNSRAGSFVGPSRSDIQSSNASFISVSGRGSASHGRRQVQSEYLSPASAASIVTPSAPPPRPQKYRTSSRRSSMHQARTPLGNMSEEEEYDEPLSDSSQSSGASFPNSRHQNRNDYSYYAEPNSAYYARPESHTLPQFEIAQAHMNEYRGSSVQFQHSIYNGKAPPVNAI